MGVMPPDRELKWQKIFRRIGIPTETPRDKETDSSRQNEIPNPAESLIPDVLLPDDRAKKQSHR